MKNSRIEDENVDFMVDDDFDNWHIVNSSIYIKNYSKENEILIFDDWHMSKSRICKYNDEENTILMIYILWKEVFICRMVLMAAK